MFFFFGGSTYGYLWGAEIAVFESGSEAICAVLGCGVVEVG